MSRPARRGKEELVSILREAVDDEDPIFFSPAELELLTVGDVPEGVEIEVGIREGDRAYSVEWEGFLCVENGAIIAHGLYAIPRKYWISPLGLSQYLDLVRRSIEIRSRSVGDILVEDFEDDDWVKLGYRLATGERGMSAAYERARKVQLELEEAAQQVANEVGRMISEAAKRLSGWGEKPVDKLLDAVETASTADDKGRALEELMAKLFETIPGFTVTSRIRTETEEIDLTILNDSKDPRFCREEAILLVECKNWSSRCGKNEFVIFKEKIENRSQRSSLGFLVSWNGFSETVTKEMLRGSRERTLIVPMAGEAVRRAVRNNSFCEELYSAWHEAVNT